MRKLLGTVFLASALFGAGVYVGDKMQPVTQQEQRLKYANMSAEEGFPKEFLSYRDSLRVNENNHVELYFGSDQTGVWRKVHADGTVGSFGEKVDEWWTAQKESIRNYFNGD